MLHVKLLYKIETLSDCWGISYFLLLSLIWNVMWLYLIWNLVKCRKAMIYPEHFTLPAMSVTEWLITIGQPVSKSCLQYSCRQISNKQKDSFHNFQQVNKSLVHGGFSWCRVPMYWFTLMLSPTNGPFFQSDMNAVITNKLAFTSLHCLISNYTLKGLRSNKPLQKHDSNNIILKHL